MSFERLFIGMMSLLSLSSYAGVIVHKLAIGDKVISRFLVALDADDNLVVRSCQLRDNQNNVWGDVVETVAKDRFDEATKRLLRYRKLEDIYSDLAKKKSDLALLKSLAVFKSFSSDEQSAIVAKYSVAIKDLELEAKKSIEQSASLGNLRVILRGKLEIYEYEFLKKEKFGDLYDLWSSVESLLGLGIFPTLYGSMVDRYGDFTSEYKRRSWYLFPHIPKPKD